MTYLWITFLDKIYYILLWCTHSCNFGTRVLALGFSLLSTTQIAIFKEKLICLIFLLIGNGFQPNLLVEPNKGRSPTHRGEICWIVEISFIKKYRRNSKMSSTFARSRLRLAKYPNGFNSLKNIRLFISNDYSKLMQFELRVLNNGH